MSEAPVTLITGTRKGVGRFLSEHYVGLGHRVVGCSRGPADWSAPAYEHYCLDVNDEKAVKRMFREVRRSHGRLDHLINNAGVASMNHTLLTPIATVERVMDTNVVGTFLFCREAARLMQRADGGRIVNFATLAVALRMEGEAIYAASKAAVLMLTRVLAKELAPMGITVNAVSPGPIDTDLIRGVPKEKIDNLMGEQAIARLCSFEDVANAVDFYLKPESGFVTGQNLYLGGVG